MASKVLSRFLPGAESALEGNRYDTVESQRMLENGGDQEDEAHFHDFVDEQELDNMLLENPSPEQRGRNGAHMKPGTSRVPPSARPSRDTRHVSNSTARSSSPGDHNDVPASLLMEARKAGLDSPEQRYKDVTDAREKDKMRQQWKQAQEHQRLFVDQPPAPATAYSRQQPRTPLSRIDRKEQALWRWANVENVDGFLLEVYQYYTDHGIWSIMLARVIYVLSTAFLFSAYMFLSTCIDYSKVPQSKSTVEILIPKCMAKSSFFKNALLWIFVFWWSWSVFRYVTDIRRLWHLHDFYHYLLGIPDSDIQTIAWERVVEGLMNLRDANPETASNVPGYVRKVSRTSQSKQRMDAHDIANRLMRRDNYYIALINKEILDMQLDLPFLGQRSFYSKSLEWCLSFCFENFIFDSHGHVQPHILDAKLRLRMIETLRRRFRFAAIISILMAPLNVSAQCIYFFSRYYAEFRNSPSQLGARAFTPYAEWRMREFNELEHDFRRRCKMSYPFADRYLAQFPRDKTIQFLQFVSLVAGTVAAVLGTATLLDPELFLGFEITSNRTAFFYLSVSMGIFAAARNAVPDDSEVHEPVLHLFEVIEYTHYAPQRWRNKFHTPAVRDEFAAMYQVKVLIFLEEILSLVAAPFILWRNAGKPSAAVIDFFRQNTVHVDGLGGLCNHAVFEFRKRNRPEDDDADRDVGDLRDEYFGGAAVGVKGDSKMAQSQYYFMQRLGRYDRNQAERYHRRLQGGQMQMPPAFPPLSPLRESKMGRKEGKRIRSPSPRASVLLDLQGRNVRERETDRKRRGPVPDRRGNVASPRMEARVEERIADLTTSKLIEADDSLAESWKFDRSEGEETEVGDVGRGRGKGLERRAKDEGARGNNGDAGVLGMLMEYSKAHGHAGAKRGGRMA
ncbi:Autophagy-related protein 9 [Sphaceloma murrayae]|uniref:Autophagy-related protein 9 n=1 Tax=Sphaceloma murrayae TaxID=2082308 RepID=A0A2K1R321_9PEZI|nr:Autophagy-related protein 9 [Sphaceloma murrayae]